MLSKLTNNAGIKLYEYKNNKKPSSLPRGVDYQIREKRGSYATHKKVHSYITM